MAASAAPAKPKGKANTLITVAAITVLAGVGGGLVGKLLGARGHAAATPPVAGAAAGAAKPLPYAGATEVKELPPVVTNLAHPADSRVRIQVAMVFTKNSIENIGLLSAQMEDDLVAFMKTQTIEQLQGPSGLQALREDINERASIRSGGKVREVIIETLVVQ